MENYNWYITFYWPTVNEWSIDIEKAWKVLSSTAKIFQKYIKLLIEEGKIEKLEKWQRIILKTDAIKNNCTSIQIWVWVIGQVLSSQPVETLTIIQAGKVIFDNFWLKDFFKQFMGTFWQQLALKILSKWKQLVVTQPIIDEKKWAEVVVKNELWDKQTISLLAWKLYLQSQNELPSMFALEKEKEEKMIIWYSEKWEKHDTWQITYEDKGCFIDDYSYDIDSKLSEPFEDDKSFDQMIIGRFIDYYGFAHKYHFSFQARKQQDKIGKHKILCMVETKEISKILDLLKPENESKGNVIIIGKATKDSEWKIDKIKIDSIHTKWETLFESLETQIEE